MAKEFVWNVVVDDVTYLVKMVGNKVAVNNNDPIKYTKLKRVAGKGANYEVPVGNKTAILRITTYAAPALILDGMDCSTGEIYEEPQLPWWIFILIVLHALGFVFLIGGAIGGAIQGCVIVVLMNIASQNNKSTMTRLCTCAGITAISLFVQYLLNTMIFG